MTFHSFRDLVYLSFFEDENSLRLIWEDCVIELGDSNYMDLQIYMYKHQERISSRKYCLWGETL